MTAKKPSAKPAAKKPVYVLMGPNLNMLGTREPGVYGHATLKDTEKLIRATAAECGFKVEFRQSNHEGDLVTWIQEAVSGASAVIINAAAYTHTSVAIHDALRLLSVPIIEVHVTNIFAREAFRHHSFVSPVANTVICGAGMNGYRLAIQQVKNILEN